MHELFNGTGTRVHGMWYVVATARNPRGLTLIHGVRGKQGRLWIRGGTRAHRKLWDAGAQANMLLVNGGTAPVSVSCIFSDNISGHGRCQTILDCK